MNPHRIPNGTKVRTLENPHGLVAGRVWTLIEDSGDSGVVLRFGNATACLPKEYVEVVRRH